MILKSTTAITEETLLDFNRSHARTHKLGLFVVYAIVTLISIAAAVYYAIFCATYAVDINYAIFIWPVMVVLFYGFYLFYWTVLIKKTVKKSKLLGARVEYEFDGEKLTEDTFSASVNEHVEIKYDFLVKVTESERYVYLYVNSFSAHLIDKEGFTVGTPDNLKQILREKLDPKKVKLK
jgi:hypothetical protein